MSCFFFKILPQILGSLNLLFFSGIFVAPVLVKVLARREAAESEELEAEVESLGNATEEAITHTALAKTNGCDFTRSILAKKMHTFANT